MVSCAAARTELIEVFPVWNSRIMTRITCNDSDGGSIFCSLWAFSADFRVLRVSPLSWRSAVLKSPGPRPSLVSDNISSGSPQSSSSMHGLDKVAHVSHVPGSASVRGIGRPAFPAVDRYLAPGPASVGWAPGSAPSALDGRLSGLLSRPAHSAADGGGRRRFGGVASTSVAIFAFRAWLWVLWDDRNGCSGPDVRVGTSRLGRRDFRTEQTTLLSN